MKLRGENAGIGITRMLCATASILLLIATTRPVQGKGLAAHTPLSLSISQNYYSLGPQLPMVSSDTVRAVTEVVQNSGEFYNSTWRPAIFSLFANNTHLTSGAWVEGFGVSLYPSVSGAHIKAVYQYDAFISGFGADGSFYHTKNLPSSDSLIQRLIQLNLSLSLGFGLSGDFVPQFVSESLATADRYVQRLEGFTPQLVNVTTAELPGKGFSSLQISVLDENAVNLSIYGGDQGALQDSLYFGTGKPGVVTVTTTATTVSTTTATTTATIGTTPAQTKDQGNPTYADYLPMFALLSTTIAAAVAVWVTRRFR